VKSLTEQQLRDALINAHIKGWTQCEQFFEDKSRFGTIRAAQKNKPTLHQERNSFIEKIISEL